MCLILFAWQQHPDYPLVLAANRDEYHQRPAEPLALWPDAPVLAGRDLQAGGTWLGTDSRGRMAAVTNLRGSDPGRPATHGTERRSRGDLPAGFLTGRASASAYAGKVAASRDRYNGFNLLVADDRELWYVGPAEARRLPAGVYGLANADLDAPWPKIISGTRALRGWLNGDLSRNGNFSHGDLSRGLISQGQGRWEPGGIEPLLEILAARVADPDLPLPDTGLEMELERRLAPVFIEGELYGTRASSVLLRDRSGNTLFRERQFGPYGMLLGERQYRWARGEDRPAPDILPAGSQTR